MKSIDETVKGNMAICTAKTLLGGCIGLASIGLGTVLLFKAGEWNATKSAMIEMANAAKEFMKEVDNM